MKNIDKIYQYLLMLLFFVVPFEHSARALPNILLIALVVIFPFVTTRKSVLKIKKEWLSIVAFIALLALNTIIFGRHTDWGMLVKVLYVPLLLLLTSVSQNKNKLLAAFVYGVFLLFLTSSAMIGWQFFNQNNFVLTNGEGVNDYLFGHRPYIGFMYVMAMFFAVYLLTVSNDKKHRVFYGISAVCFAGFVFFIAARLSTLSVLLAVVLSFFYFSKKIKIPYQWITVALGLLVVLFYGLSDNLADRFFLNNEKINFVIAEPRYYIWDCAYQIFPSEITQFLFGQGYENTEIALVECYQQKENFLDAEHKQWFIDGRFNTHNQFLDFFLSQGFIVVFLSICSFAYLLLRYRKKFFAIGLIGSLLLFFMVENVLTRQLGSILTAFLLCFVFSQKGDNN